MRHSLKLLMVIVLCAAASVASADTITSTIAGGPWSESSTWVGGIVPGSNDDVVINGPVEIAGTEACQSLDVTVYGWIGGAFAGPSNTLEVSGSVTNAGMIADGTFNFFLRVGGNLYNEGTWANHQTTVTGTYDHQLSHDPSTGFATDIIYDAGATGDLNVTTPLEVTGYVDVTGGRMVLEPDCPFTLIEGSFSGVLIAGGNEMRFESWSYLTYCTLDDVVLVGEVEASTLVIFTTRVTVMGILQNLSASGNGVLVEGDLINKGTIQNDHYGFTVFLEGNLENYGDITCSQVVFDGSQVHHISMGPEAVISADVFLPEFQPRTLVADTPVRFADGLGLGVGTLILEPGSSLQFTNWGGLGSGTILANGNEISVIGTGSLSNVTIDQGVLADQVAMFSENMFTGGLTVTGTLRSWPWDSAEITVDGLLRNEGVIQDGDHPVTITALGDVENLGTFENAKVKVAGTVDQAVGAGPGIAVPEFVLESGLQGTSYQWYQDGEPMPSETATILVLSTVGPADYGVYHCEADDQVSRSIIIAETLTTTDVPSSTPLASLEQNHPNPFNPATEIVFSLDRTAAVSLVVYDVAGRLVSKLVDREMTAGRHLVSWQPRGLPSGTYVYRLQAGGTDETRKCTLIK